MNQRWRTLLLLCVIIALLPVAASAAPGDIYITGTADDPQEYKQLRIQTVDALDPLDAD